MGLFAAAILFGIMVGMPAADILSKLPAGFGNMMTSIGLLIVFGSMVTHDYTFGKNLIMCVCTIVGMAFIMFVAVLFSGLANNIVSFVTAIVIEISYRI